MFRKNNSLGFIKGISDSPDAFTRGISIAERVMKTLMVRDIHLFPRFHMTVEASLHAPTQPTTKEIAINLSKNMKDIQMALIEMLRKGLDQIKKIRTVDLTEVQLEDCVFKKAFEFQLQEILDPIWNTLPFGTRKLVQVCCTG